MKHAQPTRTERIIVVTLLCLWSAMLIASWTYILITGDV